METAYHAKGSSLRTKLAFVEEVVGVDAARRLATELAARTGPLLDSKWYPFDDFVWLLATIAGRHLGGVTRRLVEVGEHSASRSLSSTYQAFAQRDFGTFLQRISALHGRFYDRGDMAVELQPDARSANIVLSGAPEYPIEDLYVAQGFYCGAAHHFGHLDARCRMIRGAGNATFVLSW